MNNDINIPLLLPSANVSYRPQCEEGDLLSPVNGERELFDAVYNQDIEKIKHLLKNSHCNLNIVHDFESTKITPLMLAAFKPGCLDKINSEIITLLLQHKTCNVNTKTQCLGYGGDIEYYSGYTALHFAVCAENLIALKLLIQHSECDINSEISRGWYALHLAVHSRNPGSVKIILGSKKCYINATNDVTKTALHMSAEMGLLAITKLLLKDKRCLKNKGDWGQNAALHFAAQSGKTEIVELLLSDEDIDVNSLNVSKRSALYVATINGHVGIVQLLLECDRLNVEKEGKCDLSLLAAVNRVTESISHDRKAILKLHTEHPPNIEVISQPDNNPFLNFFQAMGNISLYQTPPYYYDCVKYITNITPLLRAVPHLLVCAVEYSTTDVCRLLISKGAPVNSCWLDKETTLHCAVKINSYDKCKLLVENGADKNLKWRGLTPFEYGVSFACRPDILSLLSQSMSQNEIVNTLERFSFVNETPIKTAKRLGMPHWFSLYEINQNFTQNHQQQKPQ